MRVLITNIAMAGPGGTQTVVRDIALGLLARGHYPVVYAPASGGTGEALVERGVPLVTNLRSIAEPPDLIHGQHFIPTGEAIIRFPALPAVSMCHAAVAWIERPARFPQVQTYIAVDQACRDRLVQTEGIDPSCVHILRNAVVLSRIPERPEPLPATPRRALAFSKTTAEIPLIREACARFGIDLDVLGFQPDIRVANPEERFVRYDLVFATARSALEAICAGAAVIVCDGRGLAGFVGPEDYPRLRENNFGLRSLVRPVSVTALVGEIVRYDPKAAEAVTAVARADADFEPFLDRLLEIYSNARTSFAANPVDPIRYEAALADFLDEALPRRLWDRRSRAESETLALEGRIRTLDRELGEARAKAATHAAEAKRLRRRLRKFRAGVNRRRRRRRRFSGSTAPGAASSEPG
jgi:hypothetical protein